MRQVLLIDDDELFAEYVRDAAEMAHAAITVVDNGYDVKSQTVGDYDVVILDLTVPGPDGIQLLRFLKEQSYLGLVVIASGCDRSVINSAHQLGENYGLNMSRPLSKPFSLDDLLTLLRGEDTGTVAPGLALVETRPNLSQDSSLLPELRLAIENKQIQVFYQPRFSLKTKKLIGVESLARWTLSDGQQIPPTVFIKLAEDNDLIEPLTKCLVEKIFPQINEWNSKGLLLHVSFNYSARALHELNFPDYLSDLAEQHGVLPQHVIVELTESALADDISILMEILTRIRMKGFSLSIDDFGTGYSSVQQLQTLPFNELKIDKSFVSNFQARVQSRTIIESTVEMAHKLGIRVVAEGIEDQDAIDYLQQVGCDEGQGFYYAKPMPADEFNKWTKTNPSYLTDKPNQTTDGCFTIVALDDDLDFIEILTDILSDEFNFIPFTNAKLFLDEFAKIDADIVLLDVNMPYKNGYEICQNIKETSKKDFSVLFISGADNKEQRLKAFAAGGDDFIAKPIAYGELLAKLRTMRRYQESKNNLTVQEEMARNMAFQSMTEASQYGAILRFFKDTFTCTSQSQLIKMFFGLMDNLQLSACIQFRSARTKASFRGVEQLCSPIEDNLFEMLFDAGRLYHFKSRTMVNDKHVSVLIKNMPLEDEVTYGRYNDLLAALIEGLESKWVEILHAESTEVLIKNIEIILFSLSDKFSAFEKQTHQIIDMLILDVRSSLHVLDLSEEQENYLIKLIENGIERVMELGDTGREIEVEIKEVVDGFKRAYE
ncbi:EAL domain-containing protein [Catenovulum agarivorans]|uniref:EAL domain-containing protein n=1 Tax=Catenovulum agarivorans TaxID=1172192 RepID=UPI0002D44A85|nr:EAL domain-containing protein [Catenovulum agarivorans]